MDKDIEALFFKTKVNDCLNGSFGEDNERWDYVKHVIRKAHGVAIHKKKQNYLSGKVRHNVMLILKGNEKYFAEQVNPDKIDHYNFITVRNILETRVT